MNIQNYCGQTFLFHAVCWGSVQCTDLLLKAGADVNIQDQWGRTDLFYAVSGVSVQCKDLLLKSGAAVNIKDNCGRTALFYAAENISVQSMEVLLKTGAGVNIKDKDGQTALFDAVCRGSVQCTELLLKSGADVNIRDKNGKTILILYGLLPDLPSLNIIKLIFREGMKVNVKDNQGHGQLTAFLCKHPRIGYGFKKELVILFLAAGETVDESKMRYFCVETFFCNGISLMNICRETIRKHLLLMSQVNLFARVPQLQLPRFMTSYLLHDVTLDYDEDNKQ